MSTSLLSCVVLERGDCFSAFRFHHAFQRSLNAVGRTLAVILSKVVYELCQFKCPECPHKSLVSLMSHGKRTVRWCKLLEHSFKQNFLKEELME